VEDKGDCMTVNASLEVSNGGRRGRSRRRHDDHAHEEEDEDDLLYFFLCLTKGKLSRAFAGLVVPGFSWAGVGLAPLFYFFSFLFQFKSVLFFCLNFKHV
jgi:hypothetical protein